MSRQAQISKDLLLIGDSNVERNLLHTGRLYCQQSESVLARNISELNEALKNLPQNKYKIIIFAMLTNIVITAGNTAPANTAEARLLVIEACLKDLIRTLT
jgi:hypothetical protein